jgi:hypothetical protein
VTGYVETDAGCELCKLRDLIWTGVDIREGEGETIPQWIEDLGTALGPHSHTDWPLSDGEISDFLDDGL